KVVNSGIINASTGGSVSLVGKQVENEGVISARLGSVNLAAGKGAVVTFDSQGLIGIRVSKEILQDELGIDAAVINTGEITAEGGKILLTASVSQDIFSQAVNHEGLNATSSVLIHEDGSFTLGAGADVVNSGYLNASSLSGDAGEVVVIGENITSSGAISSDSLGGRAGKIELHAQSTALLTDSSVTSAVAEEGAKGGSIKLLGQYVGLLDEARVDASGALGGGEVLIGGDFQGKNLNIRNAYRTYVSGDSTIFADALLDGKGGKVIVWADDITRYYGNIYARGLEYSKGGFAEVSGKAALDFDGYADLRGGIENGTLLLDPENITIVENTGVGIDRSGLIAFSDLLGDENVNRQAIVDLLNDQIDVILQATNKIVVNAEINASSNTSNLKFEAGNEIIVSANINIGSGDIQFIAGTKGCGS